MITKDQQKKILARNVRKALRELNKALKEMGGCNEHDLADVAGLARSTVNRLLEAESMPGTWTISKLAKALFCKPGDLLPTLVELEVTRGQSLYGKRAAKVVKLEKRRKQIEKATTQAAS